MQSDEVMESSHTAIKSILIRSASRVGYLKTCSALDRVVVEIQIRALVKAMVNRLGRRLVEIGVYIRKAALSQKKQRHVRNDIEPTC
jgi:hypothetical protein